ncbi:MAG: EamA family transporter [Candidatus Micrarchaeota archaeon]|nr:EamA family transporter [Candidatus Micrarchaeota archaeon]MDE1834661.1 EamA family transporter [Candidatus Micrarchaeota archaeon]MDE1859265.1 EamA family transporter [Candidatus Micrarchaeota archaeon]
MDLKLKAYLFLVITLFSGALVPVLLTFAKGPGMNEFFLLAYALSIPTAYVLVRATGNWDKLKEAVSDRRNLLLIAIAGALTYFPIEYGIAFSEHYISASLATAIFRTSPLLMLLLLPIALREKLTKYQIGALLLAFAGLAIGISGGNPLSIFQNSNIGIMAFLITMSLGYAISVVMVKKYLFDISTIIMVSSVTMFAVILAIFVASGSQLVALTPLQIFLAFYIGVFFNVLSFAMYFYMLKPLKATVVSNVYFLSPFITFLFASVLIGESVQPYYLAIAGLTGIGIFVQSLDKKGSSYSAMSKHEGLNSMTIFDVTGVFANTGEVALNNTIKEGGRILAVKLPSAHVSNVNRIMAGYSDTYTDSNKTIKEEAKFVKDILGASESEFVVMKAGMLEDCEKFFEDLHNKMREIDSGV